MNLIAAILGLSFLVTTTAPPSGNTKKQEKKKEAEPTPAFVENPYQYYYGKVMGGQVFVDDGHTYTAITLHPMLDFESDMYNEQLTFCGNTAVSFSGVGEGEQVILTFSKVKRLGLCYDLKIVSVIEKSRDGMVNKP